MCGAIGPDSVAQRKPASSIAKHLMETGHVIQPTNAFRVLMRHCKPAILKSLEALLISRHRPILCVHQFLTLNVRLSWF